MLIITPVPETITLEDFMLHPADGMEWVDGKVVEKNGMTLKHSKIQLRLGRYWENYKDSSGQGGETYVEVPCRTNQQVRRPDIAYLTPELLDQWGDLATLPQSFPLIAEIVSPTDLAEAVFLKAKEYLESNCQELWLVFPDSHLVLIMTQNQVLGFRSGEVVNTQRVLIGFSVAVDELLT